MIIRNVSNKLIGVGGTGIVILPDEERNVSDKIVDMKGLKTLERLGLIVLKGEKEEKPKKKAEDKPTEDKPAEEAPTEEAPKKGRGKAKAAE